MAKERRPEGEAGVGISGVYRAVAEKRLEQLQNEMRSAHERVSVFRGSIIRRQAIEAEPDSGWLALQEVDVAHEELRVAEEELHARVDEIVAMRGALEAERRRYTELFDSAPDAYVVTDALGCVIEANQLAGTLFNLDPVFLAKKPLVSFVAAADRSKFRELVASMSKARVEAQFRVIPRKGQEKWVAIAAQGTLPRAEERPVIRWLIRDIRADQALSNREQVLGAAAQELRAPVGSIAGWLHVLSQEQPYNDVTRRALASMTRSVRTLAVLVEDLVQHTRRKQPEVKFNRTTLNLFRLIVEVIQDMRPMSETKNIHLRFAAHSYRIELRADNARLRQVFRNLLSNAIKFTPVGGTVWIEVSVVDQRAVVSVTDAGRGIAPESLATIFDPFAQIDSSAGTSAGLGLSIARRIAELHGGSITAESTGLGQGATFRVRLPLTPPN